MRRPSRSLGACLALALGALPVAAQDGVGSLTEYSAMVQVDHLWVDHGVATPEGVTLRLSRYQPNRVIPTFGVGLLGSDLADVGVAFTGEAGAGYLVGNGRAGLLLHAGVLGLLAPGNRTGGVGGYLGAALIYRFTAGLGGRVDVARRYYRLDGNPAAWSVSVGLGVVPRVR